MEKIVESLTKLLPEEAVTEVTEAVKAELEKAKETYEQEFSLKLEEAYSQLSEELKSSEETALQGYQEAYGIIKDLRKRLEMQQAEFESTMEEGYEEAYQMLQSEKSKNESLEVEMYEEFNGKLKEMKEYMVDKVDQFLQYKGKEIYEQARRDVMSDPRTAEHKVALDRVVECVSDYISDEDYHAATSTKLNALQKQSEDTKSQLKILEARNIRLSTENTKLNEQVREAHNVLNESVRNEKKERVEKAKNVQGKGRSVDGEIVSEWNNKEADASNTNNISEGLDPDMLHQMQVLAGTKQTS